MNAEVEQAGPSFAEFVIIISLMMSLTALSIDAMLPALPQIGNDLGVQDANDRPLVVSVSEFARFDCSSCSSLKGVL